MAGKFVKLLDCMIEDAVTNGSWPMMQRFQERKYLPSRGDTVLVLDEYVCGGDNKESNY